ncbi:MAG: type IV pilus assembly PilZ [Candidatus Magnetoglobus multicellularis str. Araruama]|uniref:Type IV pilus assembly PilZ n=1 Tax=Candidatus Magnetoglobus multicellularis str. Araruama TaxID=890399 RepID=A0A1V1PAX1_9BACT|nr:MAG: type IV pilus assembly PilZ [Candidatus Magnetoglobus multicellularis str. Araruama]
MEKRRRTRVEFSTQVIISVEGSEIATQANSKDLSLNGLFVESDEVLDIGTPCHVKVILPGGVNEISLEMDGRVTRHAPGGFGVIFEGMDPDSFAHLKNIAMYNSEDPDAIEDEILNVPLR